MDLLWALLSKLLHILVQLIEVVMSSFKQGGPQGKGVVDIKSGWVDKEEEIYLFVHIFEVISFLEL